MKRFVYNQKYAKLLVSMKERTSQIDELAKEIDVHAGHLRIVLEQWHKEEVISKDKPGRDYQIKLTEKGEKIATKLAELMELDDRWEKVLMKEEDKVEVPKQELEQELATEEDEKFVEKELQKNKGGKKDGSKHDTRTTKTTSIQK